MPPFVFPEWQFRAYCLFVFVASIALLYALLYVTFYGPPLR